MLDYAAALQNLHDIGSGPTEATCKTLTLRLKRTGMKWDDDNAAALMNLTAMRESGQWPTYWQDQQKKRHKSRPPQRMATPRPAAVRLA